ncbi:ribosomal L1 domain-containing protein 1 [Tupaia chinensis]|uniref:ribosomal L1 domain-containing protein 1 n=1 Tax=Tupaia chinensis TaxID=246437 RepID=UPI000FFB1C7A|nr:ribosomal L1 domain-containing protein 1 [Tupaia chinensis]
MKSEREGSPGSSSRLTGSRSRVEGHALRQETDSTRRGYSVCAARATSLVSPPETDPCAPGNDAMDSVPAPYFRLQSSARTSARGEDDMEASASPAVSDSGVPAASLATPAVPTSLDQLDEGQIRKAVEALLTHAKTRKNSNGLLLNENENLFLVVVLWKIPSKELKVRLPLPNSIRTDLAEICLFTKDEPNSTPEKTERFYRQLLNKHGVKIISQIIPFQTLKKEYKAYEAKLRLLSSFDFFLTDDRIRRLLPSHLGRHFYQRKKVPVSVNLLAKNLSKEINSSIGGTILNISKSGSCSTIRIGHTGMQAQHIVENVVAVTKRLSEKLPEKWESVKLLFVKTEKSVALPIFSSFVSSQDGAKRISTPTQKEKKKLGKEKHRGKEYEKQKKKRKKNKKIMQEGGKAASVGTKDDVAPKIAGAPVSNSGPQKGANAKQEKTGQRKAKLKLKDEPEDEIPQLVPIEETPAKGNVEMQTHGTEKTSPKKRSGPSTSRGKKRKILPASETPSTAEPETPSKGLGKKPKIEEIEKERTSSLGKKDPRQTPKKPGAKFFATPSKSAKKAPQTPKQCPPKPQVPQST